jgi:hypothetical protein
MIMTAYVWELGIDWNAVETVDGEYPVSYLRGCLKLGSALLSGTERAQKGDTITFRIFDVTPSGTAGADSIGGLKIISKAAVKSQEADQIHYGLGLELEPPVQPTAPLEITQIQRDQSPVTSSAFGPAQASWTAQTVYVTATEGRFLLTPQVLATGDNVTRLFSMDPEMVVGASL